MLHFGIITKTIEIITTISSLHLKSHLPKVYRLHLKSLKNGTLVAKLTIPLASKLIEISTRPLCRRIPTPSNKSKFMCQFSKKVLASPQHKQEDQNPKVSDITTPGHPDDQSRWQKVVIRYNTPALHLNQHTARRS